MVIGFVNSSLMTLQQAAGVIIGAKVGTTLTGLLFTFNINNIAPLVIFLGTMLMLYVSRKRFNNIGMILMGFGILFLGLNLMSTSMVPLREAAFMTDLFRYTQNPFFGIFVGFIVTAVIQSSTATMGILLSMIAAGVITDLNQAVFIIYGLNIGTCTTALLATIGGSKTAKQAATFHLIVSVIGVLIFGALVLVGFNMAATVKSITSEVGLQLVYTHIIFNVVITLILLPLSGYIIKLVEKLIKSDPESETEFKFKFIDRRLLNTPSISVQQATMEVGRMMDITLDSFQVSTNPISKIEDVVAKEELVNYLNVEINKYLVKLNTLKLARHELATISSSYKIIGHLERIGDLSVDTAYGIELYLKDPRFSLDSLNEITEIAKQVEEALSISIDLFKTGAEDSTRLVAVKKIRDDVIARIDENKLIIGITLVRASSNLDRIVNHALNIAKIVSINKAKMITKTEE
jgi:phosphate:Na+ symporter